MISFPKQQHRHQQGGGGMNRCQKTFFKANFQSHQQPPSGLFGFYLMVFCVIFCVAFFEPHAACKKVDSKRIPPPPCSCRSKTSSAHLHCDAEVLPRDPSLPRSGADGVVAQNRVLLTTELIIKLKHKTIWKLSKN